MAMKLRSFILLGAGILLLSFVVRIFGLSKKVPQSVEPPKSAVLQEHTVASFSSVNSGSQSKSDLPSQEQIPPPWIGQLPASTKAAIAHGFHLHRFREPVKISVGGQLKEVVPNSSGGCEPIVVSAKATIPIQISLNPGAKARETSFDGGLLDNQQNSQVQQADSDGNLRFNYQVGSNSGAYRVAIASAGQHEVLNFWVGPSLPQRVNP